MYGMKHLNMLLKSNENICISIDNMKCVSPLFLTSLFLLIFSCCSSKAVSISSHHSSSTQSSPAHTQEPKPLWYCPCVLYTYSWKPSQLPPPPIYPLPPPFWLLLVLNFTISGYILFDCLFCWLGSTYRWDHMVFVFHHLV